MPELNEEQIDQINTALFAGRKIEAIKIYREATSCGLKESKDFVEQVEARLRQQSPESFTYSPGKGCGTAVLFLLLVGVFLTALGMAVVQAFAAAP